MLKSWQSADLGSNLPTPLFPQFSFNLIFYWYERYWIISYKTFWLLDDIATLKFLSHFYLAWVFERPKGISLQKKVL